ncbi:MAG: FimV/HubP family polar landmark protein, partial [Gammaproteobacteria bacterium]
TATNQVRKQYADWKQTQVAVTDTGTSPETEQPGLRILAPDSGTQGLPPDTGAAVPGEQDMVSIKKELAFTAESIESYRTENAELEARLSAAEARIENLKKELQIGLQIDPPIQVQKETGAEPYGPTVAGDNLWTIANQLRPDVSISVNQMMVALLHVNPDAFTNGNINRLKRGVILHMPDTQLILSVSKEAAAEEVSAQYTAWKSRR